MRCPSAMFGFLTVGLLFSCELPPIAQAAEAAAKSGAHAAAKTPASAPADRVVVLYFHRTQRCPTCLKMGSYSEEAVTSGFAQDMTKGTVEFHYIDFEDEKNEALTKGYQVSGPTLIVAQVVGNQVKQYKNLAEMWTKVRDKAAFLDYVQSNVKDYQKK
jgi:hypothetical protein